MRIFNQIRRLKNAYSTCNVQKYRKYSGGYNIPWIKEIFVKLYIYRQISLAVFPTDNILKIVLRTLYSN